MHTSHSQVQAPGDALIELVYELLDAHHDTARLATEQQLDDEHTTAEAASWQAHLDYLRALQRTGRELVARGAEDL
jgi:hypothetical protein